MSRPQALSLQVLPIPIGRGRGCGPWPPAPSLSEASRPRTRWLAGPLAAARPSPPRSTERESAVRTAHGLAAGDSGGAQAQSQRRPVHAEKVLEQRHMGRNEARPVAVRGEPVGAFVQDDRRRPGPTRQFDHLPRATGVAATAAIADARRRPARSIHPVRLGPAIDGLDQGAADVERQERIVPREDQGLLPAIDPRPLAVRRSPPSRPLPHAPDRSQKDPQQPRWHRPLRSATERTSPSSAGATSGRVQLPSLCRAAYRAHVLARA